MTLTDWAAGYAEELLAPLRDRWAHVQGVVRQAQEVAAILPAEEREVLVAAAYLHDLGYAPGLVQTGFHALDGARHLYPRAGAAGWSSAPPRSRPTSVACSPSSACATASRPSSTPTRPA